MTELQKTQLKILEVFIDTCQKLGLEYFLVCGTALGAVKYSGYIPWDDDIDVALMRQDYEIFCQEAPKLLPEWLFLQNYRTDPAFSQVFSKLRDSRTTYIEKTVAHLPIHHGIGIDIFPLDGYPRKKIQKISLEFQKRLYRSILLSVSDMERTKKTEILCRIYRLFGLNQQTMRIAAKCDRLMARYPCTGSDIIANHGNWQKSLEYAPPEQYGKGVMMKFEGLDVRVPAMYDAYLTQKYGDWRSDPPESEQVGHHYYTVCDPEKPYTEYVQFGKETEHGTTEK